MNLNIVGKTIFSSIGFSGLFVLLYAYILNQKLDINVLAATATVILVVITFYYASITNSMLEEQKKIRQIRVIEKKLEKVYSPMDKAITEFDLEANDLIELMSGDPLSENIRNLFEKMTTNLLDIKKNYGHLIDHEVVHSHDELWKQYLSYRHNTLSQAEINTLRNLINVFHGHIGAKISDYKKRHEELH